MLVYSNRVRVVEDNEPRLDYSTISVAPESIISINGSTYNTLVSLVTDCNLCSSVLLLRALLTHSVHGIITIIVMVIKQTID